MLGLTVAVLVATFLLANFTPVNTWDCLQYHLPRQIFWIQQASVEHFPASDNRQLEMPPFAEFLSTHLMLLSGDDRWTNLIQWSAFALSAIAASLIARDPGLAPRGQAMAALFVVTVPPAAMQATNGKNDVVLGLSALVLFWIAARAWSRPLTFRDAALAGAVLGLALLTKGTAYIYCAPIGALLAIAALRNAPARRRLAPAATRGALVLAIALLLNTPHYVRNQQAFGSPLARPPEAGGYRLKMEDHSPAALASNIVRNLSIHTSLPWEAFNAAQTSAIESLHRAFGQDPSAPETTIRRQTFAVRDTWWQDGNSPAPVHLLLAALVLGAVVARPRSHLSAVACVPLLGLLLFCLLLKWQPWHSRLHIPGLLLLAPVAAAVVVRIPHPAARAAIVALCAAPVWYALAVNDAKPLTGPRSMWRSDESGLRHRFHKDVQDALARAGPELARIAPRRLGLDLEGFPQEYSVLRAVQKALEPDPRFIVMRPTDGSTPPAPDAIHSWKPEGAPATIRWHHGPEFVASSSHRPFIIYTPAPP
jgi:4-amino-4-deoxy-L-arabinose transferase-like glycosyltransferase